MSLGLMQAEDLAELIRIYGDARVVDVIHNLRLIVEMGEKLKSKRV